MAPAQYVVIDAAMRYFFHNWTCGLRPTLSIKTLSDGDISVDVCVMCPSEQKSSFACSTPRRKRSGQGARKRRREQRGTQASESSSSSISTETSNPKPNEEDDNVMRDRNRSTASHDHAVYLKDAVSIDQVHDLNQPKVPEAIYQNRAASEGSKNFLVSTTNGVSRDVSTMDDVKTGDLIDLTPPMTPNMQPSNEQNIQYDLNSRTHVQKYPQSPFASSVPTAEFGSSNLREAELLILHSMVKELYSRMCPSEYSMDFPRDGRDKMQQSVIGPLLAGPDF